MHNILPPVIVTGGVGEFGEIIKILHTCTRAYIGAVVSTDDQIVYFTFGYIRM